MIKLLEHRGIVGGYYFRLSWSKWGDDKRKKTLQEYIKDVDLENYWIYKRSGKQKIVSIDEFMKFEYSSGYILFKKSKYDKDIINKWCNYLVINFLDKPTPPFDPERIKIKK